MKNFYRIGLTLFVCLSLVTSLFAQRTTYRLRFNSTSAEDDNAYGWNTKNNTSPLTANDEAGWVLAGGPDGYLGPQRDASTINKTLYGFLNSFGSMAGTEFLGGNYRYAVVGYSENDYDDAHVSKWLTTRVFYGIKNGDQIKFWTKQKWIGSIQTASQILAMDVGSFDCNRPNRLEVRMSVGDYSDNNEPDVGNSATSVGTFTKLLLTINPNLTVTGYPNEWTQYTATVSGLPEGKTVSGRFAFRYYFEHGGYDNCRVRNDNLPSPVTEAIGGASNIASNFGGDVGGNIGLAYNSIRLATTVFAANQKGYRGSYIALDDFEYISVGTRYVENDIEEKIWYDGKQPLGTVNFSYKGSPDCISPEVRSDSRFSYMNYTSNPVTIYVSTTNDYRENAYSIKIGQKDTNQITLPPNSGVSIRVYLKAGLPTSINGPKYESLIIRDGGANGAVLHNIKLSYEILPPAPPVLLCSQTPQQVILNDSGYAMLKNPKSFDLGSSSGECGGDLTFKFLQRSNLVDEYKLTCADGGIKEVELYAVNTKTRGSATCKVKAEVIRPNGFPSSFVQNYYTDYRGKMPLTALQGPGSNGICSVVGTPKSIIKNWNRSIDYLSTNALPVGEYQVEWEMSYAAGTPDRRNVTSTLFVIDTIKPVANCKDTVEVGFDYVGIVGKPGPIGFKLRDDINPFRDINLYSYDNSGGGVTNGISKYTMYSPWYSGQSMYFADSFEIQCSNIGMSFPVTMKVADASGNFSTCQSYVKIISSTEPKCKNTTIAINPVTGIKNITTSDVLANGVGGACGMTNVALSKYSFNCSNINQTIPVSVGYTGPDSVVRGCVANVTVKSYSIPEGTCVDTVKHYLTNFSTYTTTIEPVALSACSPSLNWALTVGGTHFPSLTGGKNWSFKPGFTEVNKTAISLNDTFRCNQIYAVYDTSAPVVTAIPPNVNRTISTLNNNCKFEFEIPNPFQQGTYKEWSYTFTGATTKKVVISTSDYNYINSYWLNQWDSLNQGVTTVTLTAKDFAANETTLSYTITLNVLHPFNPSVGYFGANIPTIKGNFCGPVYNYYISSPIIAPCNQTGYMWYYEVRDAYQGTILFEQDSIPQELGAFIPLRVSAYLNHTNNNVIHFGYHEKQYGTKTFSSYSNALVQDTVSPVIVPRNETILSTNNTTFTHQYSIPSPVSYAQSCSGARWGYRVTGATTLKSAANPSITYTPNQTDELSLNDFSQFYPSIPADSSPVVNLNIGLNTIEYFILEESGVTNLWANNQYKYDVTIQDASVPTFVCAPNDTLYRSSGPCNVSVANAPTQINGFTGVFGKTGFRLIGGNNKIVLNKATAPDSITFISKTGTGSNKKPAYIYVKVNTSGTVSFNWTYQCNTPQFFRPFALSDTVNPYKANPSVLSGFIQNNTGVQTGTFSKTVVAGEVLKIGVYEGGDVNGYLKISNFSAPFITTKSSISQPTYPDNAAYYLTSNMDTVYPIGTNTVVYALTNLNNGQTTYCTKDIVVIDSFARSLNCQPKTLYLRANGSVELKVNDVLPSSCFPVSSTTLSKSIFTGADIGTQSVRITSVGTANDTLTCNVNITVLDTIKPTQRVAQLNIPLTPSNTATLTDSMLYEFFYDNHKIVSVTKSKTNFGCDDVGAQNVQLTATDSSGNTASITVQVQITPGFAPASERTNSIKLCSTDSITLNANAAQGYSLNYQWQIKEKNNTVKYWNYINSSDNEAFMAGTFGHQFFMMNNETYLAYFSSGSNTIEFKKLDTLTNNWRPALTPLSITLSSPYTFKVFVVPGFRESLEIAHINNLPNAYGMSKLDQTTNTWNTLSDYGLPFFTYQTSGPPTTTYNGTNVNLSSLVGDNGYYFTTNNAGQIYAVNRDTIGFVRAYSSVTDTLYSFGTFYKKAYDLYKPASGVSPTRVTNGKRVLGIRNSANQNIFFELQFDAIGVISGKDSLTTDPTGGSTFFAIKSLNNLDYIAYKNAAGKAAVKVYNGSNTWSVVGAADISTNEITKVELGIVKNELHLVYVELSGRLVMKKLVGNTWIDLGSPNDNISFTTVGFELFIANLNNAPAIYFTKNNGGTPRLVALTNWKNIPNANTATYTPKIDTITTEEYKCLIGNTCGVYASSQIYKLDVTATPKITSFSRQVNVVKYAHAQLSLNTNAANTNWQYGFANASSVLSSTNSLTLPTMLNDTVVYAYSFNGTCYSDTVKASVYVYDSSMNIYHVRVKDSICTGDDVQLSLDTALIGYQYSLYERDSTGAFETLVSSISKMADWQKVEFYVNPDTTTDYRIKVEKLAYDAAQFNTITIYENHIDFGDDSLPSSNEITIEGWVYGIGTSPLNILGVQNVNGGINDPNSGKNWGWSGNTFDVYNGNQKRSLTFPALPYSGNWVHVATTATPSGMKIYYNGVLVASNTLASAVNINNNTSHLRLGLRGENTKVSSLIGFDEFRVWNTARTDSQIVSTKDACLTGLESGLVFYNSFSDYDATTKTFPSLKGTNGVYQIYDNSVTATTMERNGTCLANIVAYNIPPVTVNVIPNQAIITYADSYFEAPDSICGGMLVKLVAKSSNGNVNWYTSDIGNNVIYTGDTITYFATSSTKLYTSAKNSVCVRNETEIELNDFPSVISAEVESYCWGDRLGNNSFNVNYDGYDYHVYDNPTGGTPLDINGSTGIDGDRIMTQTDTVWIEAYNGTWGPSGITITCVAPVRTPLILKVAPKLELTSIKDSTIYGEGTVVLQVEGDTNSTVLWYELLTENYAGSGPIFTTPYLTTTTQYLVGLYNDEFGCYSDFDTATATVNQYLTRADTMLACGSYTWVDGITYNFADTNLTYQKSNLSGVDSLLTLHLKVVNFQPITPQVTKLSLCTGDSSLITLPSTQPGYHYMLVDSITNTALGLPVLANGSPISFNTGALSQNKAYRLLATDTIQIGSKTLSCIQQVSPTLNLEVGRLRSVVEASTCGSYNWRNKTLAQSGVYFDTVPSTQGCDSVLELHLTIFPIAQRVDTVVACGSYTWYGTTYTSSTSTPVRSVGITEYGCDSLVRLHLILNNNTSTDTLVAWDSLTWINGIKYTSNNTTAQFTLTNSKGCDSLVTLHLTILNSVARTWYFPASICSGSSYSFNGHTYTSTGNYRDTLISSSGIKDSILVLQLTVNPTYSVNNPQTICNGSTYTFNGHTYTTTGNYRDTLQSVTGCDSIIVTQLTVNPKPITSPISGVTMASFNSIETYSVTSTLNSTYNWIITNGTQVSGTNTNSISVQWGSVITNTSVKVIETNVNGCKGDTVSQIVTLPVKLIQFAGKKVSNDVVLNWTTSTEVNNKGFQVQRSYEGKIFDSIGFVKGVGNSSVRNNYQFVDEDIFNNKSIGQALYYRLKQVDFDGKEELSQMAIVNNPNAKVLGVQVSALPNPFRAAFDIKVNSEVESTATIRIYDALGKQVLNVDQPIKYGESIIPISDTYNWEAGLYQVTVTINGNTHVVRVVKY